MAYASDVLSAPDVLLPPAVTPPTPTLSIQQIPLEREDLTPIEEAWAFAQQVRVEVGDEWIPCDEYVSNLAIHVNTDGLYIPSDHHADVEAWADAIGYSPAYIHQRFLFLTLPEEQRKAIDNGDLTKKAASRNPVLSVRIPPSRGVNTVVDAAMRTRKTNGAKTPSEWHQIMSHVAYYATIGRRRDTVLTAVTSES